MGVLAQKHVCAGVHSLSGIGTDPSGVAGLCWRCDDAGLVVQASVDHTVVQELLEHMLATMPLGIDSPVESYTAAQAERIAVMRCCTGVDTP